MPNYKLGKIYQIVCLTTGQKYVGSTTQKTLAERLAGHNCSFKRWKNGTGFFMTSYTVLEKDNYRMELLEAYPCGSKDELNAREGKYIQAIECVNKNVAGRTKEDWYEDNKIVIAKKHKEYYEENKTKLSVNMKEYLKDYRIENKTKIAIKSNEYYEANKAKKLARQKARYEAKKIQYLLD